MKIDEEQPVLYDQLLHPVRITEVFKRKNPNAFRFKPYSKKIKRRLDLYTSILYDLWVNIEWDIDVKYFNERVEAIPIPGKDGRVFYWKPKIVSVSSANIYCAHTITRTNSSDQASPGYEIEPYLQRWSNANDVKLRVWMPEEIRSNPILLANRKQLYGYVSNPETVVSPTIKENILLILRKCRKTTLDDLIQSVGPECEDTTMPVIANLILSREIYSDISKYALGWTTEISCFHEFT